MTCWTQAELIPLVHRHIRAQTADTTWRHYPGTDSGRWSAVSRGCRMEDNLLTSRRPNIIHAYASGRFVVRSETSDRLDALKKRVLACFEGAAAATGAELVITQKGGYANHRPNKALGRSYRKAFNSLGGDILAEEVDWLTAMTRASTDQGDVSHAVPSISPNFW